MLPVKMQAHESCIIESGDHLTSSEKCSAVSAYYLDKHVKANVLADQWYVNIFSHMIRDDMYANVCCEHECPSESAMLVLHQFVMKSTHIIVLFWFCAGLNSETADTQSYLHYRNNSMRHNMYYIILTYSIPLNAKYLCNFMMFYVHSSSLTVPLAFWHSIGHIFRHSIWHAVWHSIWHSICMKAQPKADQPVWFRV